MHYQFYKEGLELFKGLVIIVVYPLLRNAESTIIQTSIIQILCLAKKSQFPINSHKNSVVQESFRKWHLLVMLIYVILHNRISSPSFHLPK